MLTLPPSCRWPPTSPPLTPPSPSHCSNDVASFLSGDFPAIYGEAASLKSFELAFFVHNGRNVVQMLPPLTLSPGATTLPEFTLKNVHLDTGIVLVALVRAVLVFSGSSAKASSLGLGWLPLPLATCSLGGAALTGAIESAVFTSPLPPALCCPIPGHPHFILKPSAGAAASFACQLVCASDDENMPLTAPDALGLPGPDDFADEDEVQQLPPLPLQHVPADEDVIEDSAAAAPPHRPPPPAPRRASSAELPLASSSLSLSASSSSSSSSSAAASAAPAPARPHPSTSRPAPPRASLPLAPDLHALLHVTFSFELRGAVHALQVDNDQPFSDFRSSRPTTWQLHCGRASDAPHPPVRKLLVARAGRGVHLVANLPGSPPLALTSEAVGAAAAHAREARSRISRRLTTASTAS